MKPDNDRSFPGTFCMGYDKICTNAVITRFLIVSLDKVKLDQLFVRCYRGTSHGNIMFDVE